jgi:crotonobetainyl-CoA:carnitine CoA-transferase CaiB-like acyl-CoA transferase
MFNFRPDFIAQLSGTGVATRYAEHLLTSVGAIAQLTPGPEDPHPARRWADSGLMALTGKPADAPLMCPVPLASQADGALTAFRALSGKVVPESTGGGAELMAERAWIVGHHRQGSISPGGSCHLLPTLDGQIGVNLARESDWDMLPAWLQVEVQPDWNSVALRVAQSTTARLLEQGQLLGLAVADAISTNAGSSNWCTFARHGQSKGNGRAFPKVLDLSSLWAGPLCSHLFQRAGATVIKVESTQRPDGARAGPPQFFELLNQGKQSVALALNTRQGQRQLRALIDQVDVVIEGSRPRALRQMGIIAEDIIDTNPGLTWLSINGYGRNESQASRLAYGDDAGVAAGLSRIMHEVTGQWVICGDAIADPLTGIHAAVSGWASWLTGGGHLLDLSLYQTVGHCIHWAENNFPSVLERQKQWLQCLGESPVTFGQAAARPVLSNAAALGADNHQFLRGLDSPAE